MAVHPVLDFLRRIRASDQACKTPDADLLARFVASRDEPAFAALVQRHGPMVLRLCVRVLGDSPDAEDAFQAAFLVLARRASSVSRPELLGNWLYGVAYRTALKVRAGAARRQTLVTEKRAVNGPNPVDEAAQSELRRMLDEELSRLPDRYRVPLVLHYLEGRTQEEVALLLGCSRNTIHSRLTRACERLRGRLTRRGLAMSSAGLAAALSEEASAALQATLLHTTVKAATLFAAGGSALATTVVSLAERVIQAMFLTKVKIALGCVVLLGAVATGAGVLKGELDARGQRTVLVPSQPTQSLAAVPAASPSSLPRKTSAEVQRKCEAILHDALKEADAVNPAVARRLLADIAVAQANVSGLPAAMKTFQQARHAFDALPDWSKFSEYRMLAMAHAAAGDADGALAVAQVIPDHVNNVSGKDKDFRNMVLQESAETLAREGHLKDALRVLSFVEDKDRKANWREIVLYTHAIGLARVGKFRESLEAVGAMAKTTTKVSALAGVLYVNYSLSDYPHESGIILLQAQAGDKAGARKSLERLTALSRSIEVEKRAPFLARIACVQARLDDIPAALATLGELNGDQLKEHAVAAIVQAQARTGKVKDARITLQQLTNPIHRLYAFLHLGVGQAQGGDRAGARETLQEASSLLEGLSQSERTLHEHNLASAKALAGDFEGALKMAASFRPPRGTATFAYIAYAQAKAGDIPGAINTADRIDRIGTGVDWLKGDALRRIAMLEAERGEINGPPDWTNRLSSGYERANAFLGVAEGLIRRGMARR